MKFSHRQGFIDRESYVVQYLVLAVFIAGVVSTVGSDDLLAAFAAGKNLSPKIKRSLFDDTHAGCAISWNGDFNVHTEGEVFASVIDMVLNCGCFIYIGAWIPFDKFTISELDINPSKLVTLTVGIMLLRRIPVVLVLYKWIPEISTWKEALFSGHFGNKYIYNGSFLLTQFLAIGPMGVGAIFISTFALQKLPLPADPPIAQGDYFALSLQPIVSFVILASIIIRE